MNDKHEAEFYVEFHPDVRGRFSANPSVWSVKATKLTQKKPEGSPGSVLVRFKVSLPDEAFIRLIPTAEVNVPLDYTEGITATVEPILAPEPVAEGVSV